MKNVDVRTVKREELADIREVEVNVIDMGNMLLRLALRIQQ